ncbi:RebB family R body protein [Telmatobacter bradus]|uniref:RebB family R body protein n=1 Tax=Telmatobacter bradus TaxID=474953 RepID=UPI003B436257
MKMTLPSPINSQITDSIAQANQKEPGEALNVAMGELFLATSEALANAAHHATTQQKQYSMTAQAEAAEGIATLYSLDANATKVVDAKLGSFTQPVFCPLPLPTALCSLNFHGTDRR